MRDIVRTHVALDVVDRDQRLVCRIGQRLGRAHADEQRAHQARAIGHSNRIDVRQGHVRLLQAFIHHRIDALHVLARGNLRHHAAVHRMQRNLRRNDRGDDLAAVADDRRRRLVTAGFNRKDGRMAAFLQARDLFFYALFVVHN